MLTKESITLGLCLRELHTGFPLIFLEQLVVLQRKMYLLQELGINLGCYFNWVTYGPFSDDLNEQIGLLELHRASVQPIVDRMRLKLKFRPVFDKVEKLSIPPPGITENSWLILLTSLHYYARTFKGVSFTLPAEDPQLHGLVDTVFDRIPDMRRYSDFVALAWERLREVLLEEPKQETSSVLMQDNNDDA